MHYDYLWADEACEGAENGAKARPCAIILATETIDGRLAVALVPITHSPQKAGEGLPIPTKVAKHLGLDGQPSWVVVTELNRFLWPGPDLAAVPRKEPASCVYGVIPSAFFEQIKAALKVFPESTVTRTD